MLDVTAPCSGISEAARHLYADTLVWDNHSGFEPSPSADLSILDCWQAAGVDYLSVGVGYDGLTWQQTLKNIGAFLTWIEKHADRFTLAQRAGDILNAKREGKMAIGFDVEGMNALDGETYLVSLFYRLGVRQMLFAYNRSNLTGGGCHDDDDGLTELGRHVIEEMNRVGMVVDCTHTGYRTTMEVMEMSSQPVIFSHSNPKALHAHGRNIEDDQIHACARTGGVVGINGIGLFLSDRQAPTKSIVDCICYVAELVGPDHVGIGLDHTTTLNELNVQNPALWPVAEGYGVGGPSRSADPSQLLEVTHLLLKRGWSEADIRKVLGGNFFRVASYVWK